jgi:hypothetical protein
MELRGRWVHFRIRDVYVPDPLNLLEALHGDDVLEGRVVAVSQSGEAGALYVVVEVAGYPHPLVVAARVLDPSLARE